MITDVAFRVIVFCVIVFSLGSCIVKDFIEIKNKPKKDYEETVGGWSRVPRLTFQQFLIMYNVNPDSWDFQDVSSEYLVCYKPERICLTFETYDDYKEFDEFRTNKNNLQKEKRRNENLLKVVQSVQRDLKKQISQEEFNMSQEEFNARMLF